MSFVPSVSSVAASSDHPDAALDRLLRRIVLTGLALVVLLPLARASTDMLGGLPLWLVGMPAAAWWALHRFRMPGRSAVARTARRRRGPQARRLRLASAGRLQRAA